MTSPLQTLLAASDDVSLGASGRGSIAAGTHSIRESTTVDEAALEKVSQQIALLTGLGRAKQEILATIALIRVATLRSGLGLTSDIGSFHAVFSGNPGTGKTTFARLYAASLKALGVARKDSVVEVSRADLVAGFIGQTAIKTRAVAESAIGGVLFVDEAYAIVNDDHDSFGHEALAELIKIMEDHRSDLVVVLAGYTEDMDALLRVNPGLQSRILSIVHFDDYNDDELLAIARSIAETKKYRLDPMAEVALKKHFDRLRRAVGDRAFGNAREARNAIERMIRAHAMRLVNQTNPTLEQLMQLQAEDLPGDPGVLGREADPP